MVALCMQISENHSRHKGSSSRTSTPEMRALIGIESIMKVEQFDLTFRKKEEGKLPKLFYKAGITLIPKPAET